MLLRRILPASWLFSAAWASFFDLTLDLEQNGANSSVPSVVEMAARDGSKGLEEFTPIRNTIVQSDTQYYSFNVNSSTGLGEYYEYLVFISGNICAQPSDLGASANESLAVYYSFNASFLTDISNSELDHFEDGYFQALADVSVSSSQSVLYIAVRAPQSTNVSASWSYEIGVSQQNLVYQWDSRSFAELVDTDDSSALIVSGNLTVASKHPGASTSVASYNTSLSNYQLLVYGYDARDYFDTLSHSWCAVKNGPYLDLTANVRSSYTTRKGGLYQQFHVTGLNVSTKYVGYLVSDVTGSQQGGTLYDQFVFETMSTDACSLIYDLDFCDQVAYSVPASSLDEYADTEALSTLYDDRAKDLFSNFSKALQQVACEAPPESVFSPLGSCRQCNTSYKDWLCSVTIPRCSTRNITGYIHREANDSRTDFINDDVVPKLDYFEVLPCVNVCQAIVRECPADFGFMCPTKNASIALSYYWDEGGDPPTCNFVGYLRPSTSGGGTLTVLWGLLLWTMAMVTMII